jgi:hypothetical protein
MIRRTECVHTPGLVARGRETQPCFREPAVIVRGTVGSSHPASGLPQRPVIDISGMGTIIGRTIAMRRALGRPAGVDHQA